MKWNEKCRKMKREKDINIRKSSIELCEKSKRNDYFKEIAFE